MKHKLLLLMLLIPMLSGCYDTLNVDDQSYPVAVGIDVGETKNYKISLHIPVQKKSDSGAENTSEIVETESDNLYEVKSKLDSVNPWVLNFSHLSYFIVSDEIAESGALEQLIEDGEKAFLLKKSAVLIVVNGKAGKFMEGLNDDTLTPDQVLDDLFIQQKAAGTLLHTNINAYLESVKGGLMDVCAALGTYTYANEEIASRLEGSAVFSRGVMTGKLTPLQTQLLLIGMGKFKKGNFSPARFGGEVSFQLEQRQQPSVKYLHQTNSAEVEVYLGCKLYTHSDDALLMQAQIEEYIFEALNDLFAYCSRLECDALGLGERAIRNYAFEQEWEMNRPVSIGSINIIPHVRFRESE